MTLRSVLAEQRQTVISAYHLIMNTKGSAWFWLAIVAILGGVWYYQSWTPANDIQWTRDFDVARQTAATMDRPMMLYFTADWCPPCKQMKRQVWTDAETEAFVNNQTVPVYLDVDKSEVEPIAARYQVSSIPTIVLTDSAGNMLPLPDGTPARSVGFTDTGLLIGLIEAVEWPMVSLDQLDE